MKTANYLLCPLIALGVVLSSPAAQAHWCSNIYQTFSRIVVKPERDAIDVAVGETGKLKVWVRNNFPYTLHYIKLRVAQPSGLSIQVSPNQQAAESFPVVAGQEVTFTLHITREAEGSDHVSDLNLEIATTVEDVGESWRGSGDQWIDQDPSPLAVREHLELGLHQAAGITNAKLADMDCAGCREDGVSGLLALLQSRLDPCEPDGFDSPWPMQFIRSGQQLAIRLRFGSFSNPDRSQVVGVMIRAMDDATDTARGLAAFHAAYGGNDPGVLERIQAMAEDDPSGECTFTPSTRAQMMAQAALLLLGDDSYRAEVSACVNDEGLERRVRACCAAALGIMGEDEPVANYLLGQVPNGKDTTYDRLFASYLLQLVVLSRRGGPDAIGQVSFLDEEPRPDPPGDSNKTGCASLNGSGAFGNPLVLILGLWALVRRRRA